MKVISKFLPFRNKKKVELPAPVKKYTFMEKLSGKARKELEENDINNLKVLSTLAKSLDTPPLNNDHPLHSIATSIKRRYENSNLDFIEVTDEFH